MSWDGKESKPSTHSPGRRRPGPFSSPQGFLELVDSRFLLAPAYDWDKVMKALIQARIEAKDDPHRAGVAWRLDVRVPYLCPGRMSRLQERLDLLRVIKSMAELPPEKEKILVIDAAQVPTNWQLGMMHNHFARWLEAMEDQIREIPNLWVLSSTGVDQGLWPRKASGKRRSATISSTPCVVTRQVATADSV